MADGRHSVISEGIDVGLVGGLVVAAWFLILDLVAGHPLQTPNLLGQIVLFGDPQPQTQHLLFGSIVLYTAFHFLTFAFAGMAIVALVHWGETNPIMRYALVPLFLALQVMLYGLYSVLSMRTNQLFPFWTVLTANTLAAVAMAYFLWIRHPGLRRSIQETPLGDAPMQ